MAKPSEMQDKAEQPVSAAKTALILIASIGGAIAGLAAFLWYVTPDTGDTVVSGHGTVAMVLGVIFSLIVGIGLMGLVFYSSRRGYDEQATASRRDRHVGAPGE